MLQPLCAPLVLVLVLLGSCRAVGDAPLLPGDAAECLVPAGPGAGESPAPAPVPAAGPEPRPFLGNARCPKSGRPVRLDCYFEHRGERAYFCNPDCAAEGGRDPERWLALVYPDTAPAGNAVCPVTGAELGGGGGATVRFQGRLIRVEDEVAAREFWDAPRRYAALALSR